VIRQNPLIAAGALRTAFGDENFYKLLRTILAESNAKPTAAHRALPQIGFASILTTNFDKLIEGAFAPATPCYMQFDHAELAQANRDRRFCIVKVHGDIDRIESIVFGQTDYRRMMFGNDAFPLAPRALPRFPATTGPAATVSPSVAFPVCRLYGLPCSTDFSMGRGRFLQLLDMSMPPFCPYHPTEVTRRLGQSAPCHAAFARP
jgi:hypothetical protein